MHNLNTFMKLKTGRSNAGDTHTKYLYYSSQWCVEKPLTHPILYKSRGFKGWIIKFEYKVFIERDEAESVIGTNKKTGLYK